MTLHDKEKGVSIADAVFDSIEQAILNGTLKGGEILTEHKLCDMLSVSRTPVREAMGRLRQEGLIEESGKDLPVSHLETARSVTFSFSASCICVSPTPFRQEAMNFPILI